MSRQTNREQRTPQTMTKTLKILMAMLPHLNRKTSHFRPLSTQYKANGMQKIDDDTLETGATPTEICQEIGIDRRTFNSVISKAIFTKHPTDAQTQLRAQIMEILYTDLYANGFYK